MPNKKTQKYGRNVVEGGREEARLRLVLVLVLSRLISSTKLDR